ncbi:uncharacterized protein BX663DRAFT_539830 [Cokeromyces recurvatus]|uniref:uncharacterized protein n=1 Tax=Cokeromyces recurvatus TaxID=90255 RepID=UPI00221F8161|nr:uncharacterized protein BX663DRAFT_539830 [Cokeromyces recurvatus]KAI7907073.1 hypothetical protein BX663DRAFT_539830 [Cokeromyces recurvatus]
MLNRKYAYLIRRLSSTFIKLLFLFLCYPTTIITSQLQECLSLNSSNTCHIFSTAFINIQSASVRYAWLNNVTTPVEFDHQLLNYVNSSNFWNLELGCKTSSSLHTRQARYAVSLICATLVFNYSCYHHDPSETVICQSTCKDYLNSIQLILKTLSSEHNNICQHPFVNDALARNNTASLSEQCNTNSLFKGQRSTGCISLSDHEFSDTCGFGNDIYSLCSHCEQNNSKLICCSKHDCSTVINNSHTQKQSNQKTISSSSGVIAGALSSLLSLYGFFLFCCNRKKKKRMKTKKCSSSKFIYNQKKMEDSSEYSLIHYQTTNSPSLSTHLSSVITCTNHSIVQQASEIDNSRIQPAKINLTTHNKEEEKDDSSMGMIIPENTMNKEKEDSIAGQVFKVNSLEKQFVRAVYAYNAPVNPDELELVENDILRMYYYFDDGWAFGDNYASDLRGFFPLLCVVNLTKEEVHELQLYSSIKLLEEEQDDNDKQQSSLPHHNTCSSSQYQFSTTTAAAAAAAAAENLQYNLASSSNTYPLKNLHRALTLQEKERSRKTDSSENHSYKKPPINMTSLAICQKEQSITINQTANVHHSGTPPLRKASIHVTAKSFVNSS